jgi:hypothetical protein
LQQKYLYTILLPPIPVAMKTQSMKNLLFPLLQAGLSEEQALKSIQVVYSWVETHYPVLAVTARRPLSEAFPELFKQPTGSKPG